MDLENYEAYRTNHEFDYCDEKSMEIEILKNEYEEKINELQDMLDNANYEWDALYKYLQKRLNEFDRKCSRNTGYGVRIGEILDVMDKLKGENYE